MLGLGCERPLVEISTPEITVLAPDLSNAFAGSDFQLVVSASSFRSVTRVTLNGFDMTRNPSTGNWEVSAQLGSGLNALIVEASDTDNVTTTDTLYALRLGIGRAVNPPRLPTGRGGHSVTALLNGVLLIAGGAPSSTSNATTEILELSDDTGFSISAARLNEPRVGHTASLLPDGRVLFLGGARNATVSEIQSLVEEVEILDPQTRTVTEIPFAGGPIRRAFHTASVRLVDGFTLIDLYGGLGDVAYTPQPRLGIRSDIRTFQLRNDSLIALSPSVGGRLIGPTWGHSQTSLFGAEPAPTSYLIGAGLLEATFDERIVAVVDFADPRGLVADEVALPTIPRLQHADVRVASGFIAYFGGRTDAAGTLTRTVEIFARDARRFFTVPVANLQPISRYAHRASLFFGNRILVIGGFDDAGNGVSASEIFVIEL